MSRHHPYSGYDESAHSGGGHRKNGLANRGANGRAHSHGGRPGRRSGGGVGGGGGGGGGAVGGAGGAAGGNHHHGFGSSHSSSAGSNKSGWDASFERELAHVPRGPAKSFKNRGPLRGHVAAKLRANGFQKLEQGERELSIDERIQRERPCRTLFVRNVKYETDSQEVREKFEQMGQIKIFFDLISTRGMAFITYYDLRAATMAKERLQGTDVSGRPIDVHYSLPKDNELERGCDRDKNQGTLFVSVNDARRPIQDGDLRSKFSVYGEIRSIKPFKDSPFHRFVEFWDSRACELAHDSLDGSPYLGGNLQLKFSWDTGMVPKGRPDWRAGQEEDGFYGPDDGHDYSEHDEPRHQAYHQDHRNGHGSQDPYHYNSSHTVPKPTSLVGKEIDERRLDQAHKVQQLLASLTKVGSTDNNLTGGVPTLVSNYPPKLPSGVMPSNFVSNYPTQQPAPMLEYGQGHSTGGAASHNQLAQIMGQLSSFSSAATQQQQQQQQQQTPSLQQPSAAANPQTLALPPSLLALLKPQNSTANAPAAAANPAFPQLSPAIPTAPRAMQAAAAIASLSSASSAAPSSLHLPTPPPAQPFNINNNHSAPASIPAATNCNPQAAVQQLLALLQQQQQQKQH